MAITFEPKGPELKIDETTFKFKRVSQAELNAWNLKNNPFKDRSEPEKRRIQALIQEGKISDVDYTEEEIERSLNQLPRFAVDFCTDVKPIKSPDGSEIEYSSLSQDQKLILFEELYSESEDFSDFLLAYKAGVKKKFTELASDK